VVEFLRQQARIRATLPMRLLMVCQTCRFEKVVNPDFQRLAKRNSRLKTLLGAVGASWGGSGGLRAFVAVGKVLGSASLDPEFVCLRCQGTVADEYVVTYCPKCGDRRMDAVLRACPRCKHDFRKDVPAEVLWHSEASLVVPAALARAVPPPAATAAAADWYPDPVGGHQLRYWDGTSWTDHVADDGREATSPVEAAPLGTAPPR
jgi:hypothetical protein